MDFLRYLELFINEIARIDNVAFLYHLTIRIKTVQDFRVAEVGDVSSPYAVIRAIKAC